MTHDLLLPGVFIGGGKHERGDERHFPAVQRASWKVSNPGLVVFHHHIDALKTDMQLAKEQKMSVMGEEAGCHEKRQVVG
ncbi:hypothetical protein [Salmonella enterica]|uniref:hypothetical protein n=1 Tax=Salmonella enterica TaxID=28901 RepID=UPI00398C36E9